MTTRQTKQYSFSRTRPTFLYKTKKHDSESEPVLVSVEGLAHRYGLSKKTARRVAIELVHLAHKRWPRAYFVLAEEPHFAMDTILDYDPEDTEVITLRDGALIPAKDILNEGWDTVKSTVQSALANAAITNVKRANHSTKAAH
jgi:hypothetical protein